MTHRELVPIPPIETATDPIHSPADMRQRWRALMGPLGFGERLLRFSFVGPDRRMVKVLGEVPIRLSPEPELVRSLMVALSGLVHQVGEDSTVALLLTRPGVGPVSNADRQWSTSLTRTAAEFEVPLEPIFRANDEALVPLEPDDLEATG
ncbi:MAG: hypothetical protein QOK33_3179 [Mycobacterium sp.]|jgi:hypothetical protein|nr:hypothetical protein [Mycobacterium sp.]